MKLLAPIKSERPDRLGNPRGARSQGLVEFTLVLPILLLIIFVIIELARLLYAWLAIENGARFGVRYAVTGEYDAAYCLALPGACVPQSEADLARISSIKDAANSGAVAILKNSAVTTVGQPGFFKITVCSNKAAVGYVASNSDTPSAASCVPQEDPGGPGDRVSVTIDYDHPIISPIISSAWPNLHLTARREGIVERYRTARVVGLPATISGPTPTPSQTPTPSLTPTPSNTSTPTYTPSPTPTPDCSDLRITSMWISGDDVRANVRNDNFATAYLVNSYLEWSELNSSMRVNYFEFDNQHYYDGDDNSSPTEWPAPNIPLAGGGNTDRWQTDFSGEPYEPIWGTYYLELTFNFPDWGECIVSRSITAVQPPPPPTKTPQASNTPGPSPTPNNTKTPSPTKTPGPTSTSGPPDTPVPPDPPDPTDVCVEC